MLNSLVACGASFGAVLALVSFWGWSAPPAYYELRVDGFVAGAGSDCAAAWQNAVLPTIADWREIRCERIR